MVRPKPPVSGNRLTPAQLSASIGVYNEPRRRQTPQTDRNALAAPWQIEAYRHVSICGEAKAAVRLFSAYAGRAEIGISEAQTNRDRPQWIKDGPEVDALAEVMPTVRDRVKFVRTYTAHMTIAGECYLIFRERTPSDPGYVAPPLDYTTWAEYLMDFDPLDGPVARQAPPIAEIVAVTELRRNGQRWEVRHENGEYLLLSDKYPVLRFWEPDEENRQDATSPFKALLPTLREIEWETTHIFTQIKSRIMNGGMLFLPNNLTFPSPPPSSVQGGQDTLDAMNETERLTLSLMASATDNLDADEVSFPTIITADPNAVAAVSKDNLIQFWSQFDDKVIEARNNAIGRFARGINLPADKVIESGAFGSKDGAGSGSNHWGEWAKEEQTITSYVEPGLDVLVAELTEFVRLAVPETDKVVGYGTATMRIRPDRSKEALELNQRGLLSNEVALRENGFDPATDMMSPEERKWWMLDRITGSSIDPSQMAAVLTMFGIDVPAPETSQGEDGSEKPVGISDGKKPQSLADHPYEGPPREQHDHSPAAFSVLAASCEVLVLRALEKAGNRLLNDGVRGRDRIRTEFAHMAHVGADVADVPEFDFALTASVFVGQSAMYQGRVARRLSKFCENLYETGTPYTREGLLAALEGLN